MKGMRTKFMAGLAVAVTALVAGVGSASAAPGLYQTPEGACDRGVIYTYPVTMGPSAQSYSSGSTFSYGGTQRVAFRANLAQKIGNQWYRVQQGSWMTFDVSVIDYMVDSSIGPYFDQTTKTWGSGTTLFRITQHGEYSVYFDLYWYPTQSTAGVGLSPVWAGHRDLRTYVYDLALHHSCIF
jgi:hypothetical protein